MYLGTISVDQLARLGRILKDQGPKVPVGVLKVI